MSDSTIWVVLEQKPGHGIGHTRFPWFDVALTTGVPAEWNRGLFDQVHEKHPEVRPAVAADFAECGLEVPRALRPRAPRPEKSAKKATAAPAKAKASKKATRPASPARKRKPAPTEPAPEAPITE